MLVAEELQCHWSKVRSERASSSRMLGDPRQYLSPFQDEWESSKASASRSVKDFNELLRQVGASARERLIAAAAQEWKVPISECHASDSLVTHTSSGRTVSYGVIAAAAAAITLEKEPELKTADKWWLLGTRVKRLDTPARIDGSLTYGIDVRLPDMLYASAVSCPVFGGKLKSFDFSVVANRPGIIGAVEVDQGVAIVADTFWRAKTALDLMPIEWDVGPNVMLSSGSIAADLDAALERAGETVIDEGDAATAIEGADKVIEGDYAVPFIDQAALEPMACTARFEGDALELWCGTQCDLFTAEIAAEVADIAMENVTLHVKHLGSSYGRREHRFGLEWVSQAIQVAKTTGGRPVKLIWTREQDMTHSLYRPNGVNRVRAGLDASGELVGIHAHLVRGSWLIQSGAIEGPVDPLQASKETWWPYDVSNQPCRRVDDQQHCCAPWQLAWCLVGVRTPLSGSASLTKSLMPPIRIHITTAAGC